MTIVKNAVAINAKGIHTNGNSKPIFCITTGELFASLSDAVHSRKGSIGTMSCAMKHRNGIYKGEKWCYVVDIEAHLDEIATDIRTSIEKTLAYDAMMAKKEEIKKEEVIRAEHETNIENLRKQIDELQNKLLTEIILASEATERINNMKEEFFK